MLEIMSHNALHTLVGEIKALYYTVIADDTIGITTQEQVLFCFHIVIENMSVEEF